MFLLTAAATSGRSADTGPITTMHLILIGVLIVLVVLAIVWGARQKRARVAGEQEEARRTEALLAHPPTDAPKADPAPLMSAPAAAAPPPAPKPAAKPRATAKVPAPKAAAPKTAAPKAPAAKAPAAKSAPTKAPAAKAPAAKAPVKAAAPKPAAAPKTAPASAVVKPAPAPKTTAKAAPAKPAAKSAAPAAQPKAAAPKPLAAKAVAPKAAAPKPVAKPADAPATAYNLIDVKGLGPKAVPLLEGMGVRTLSDLAGLSAARAAEVDAGLGALSGRLARDRWIDQAKLLSVGKVAEFEAAYGKL